MVINEEYYKKKTCLEAISFALKVFFVFDCNYPENSLTLWLFVQKCLFNLNLPKDLNNLSLNVFLGQLKEKLKSKEKAIRSLFDHIKQIHRTAGNYMSFF